MGWFHWVGGRFADGVPDDESRSGQYTPAGVHWNTRTAAPPMYASWEQHWPKIADLDGPTFEQIADHIRLFMTYCGETWCTDCRTVVRREHPESITSEILSSLDGKRVVTGSEDNTARLWDLNSPEASANPRVLRGHEGWVDTVAFSHNGQRLATGAQAHL